MHSFDNFEYESELFFNLHRHSKKSKKSKKPKQENTKKKQEKKQEKQEIVTPIIVKFIYTVKVDIDI